MTLDFYSSPGQTSGYWCITPVQAHLKMASVGHPEKLTFEVNGLES